MPHQFNFLNLSKKPIPIQSKSHKTTKNIPIHNPKISHIQNL